MKSNFNRNGQFKALLLAGSIISGMAVAAPAFAQDADVKASGETVVITGSRITRPNETSPTAIQVIDAKLIESTGEVNTGDLLRTLPSIGVQGLTATNSNFFTQGNGVSTVDLRNLGTDRTLVLVNGRRFVAGLPGTQVVDFNSVPTDLISRIDVVTGGASAVYGSDALAGVINIVTQKRFEGFDVFGQAGQTERKDLKRFKMGFKVGSNFAEDRGNFVGSLSYTSTGAVYAKNRAEYGMDQDGLGGAFFGDDTRETFFYFPSSFTKGGVAVVPRTGLASLNRVVDSTGATVPYDPSVYGFNRQAERLLYVPNQALNLQAQVNYDFSDKLHFYLESSYYKGKTDSDIEPTPLGSSDLFRDPIVGAPLGASCTGTGAATVCRNGISINSAIIPVSLRNAVIAANPGADPNNLVVGFQRRLTEFGNRQNHADRDLARISFGFSGELDETTSWETSLTWGRTQESQISEGQVLRSRVLDATDTIVLNGQVVCASSAARANGCAPWYVFQQDGGPQAAQAIAYMGIDTNFSAYVEELVWNANLQGETTGFKLPAGSIKWSLGAEYRSEKSENIPDTTLQKGLSNSNIAPKTSGEFDVKEAFVELKVPVLKDLPFAQKLDLNFAGRISDYSTIGSTNAWAVSLEYQPISWLKARSQYSVAVRAPNISELFAGKSQTFPTVTDPCRGLTLSAGTPAFFTNRGSSTSGINAATIGSSSAVACYSDAAIAARVARDGFFIQTQPELQGVGGFNEGNPKLGSETSKSFTAGLLFNPRFNQYTENLRLSVDYYDIEITDAIQGYGRNLTLSRCYGGSIPSARDPFYCQFAKRHDASSPNVGALYEVNQQNFNIGGVWTSGLDVQASYGIELNKLPMFKKDVDYGRFNLGVNYQYLISYDTQALPGGPISTAVGNIGTPKHEAVVDFAYQKGDVTVSLQTQIIGRSCFFGTSCDSNDYVNDLPFPVIAFTDAQIRYEVSPKAIVSFGVDNIFDEFVRIGQSSGQPTGWATDPNVYDGLGRRFYVATRLKF